MATVMLNVSHQLSDPGQPEEPPLQASVAELPVASDSGVEPTLPPKH